MDLEQISLDVGEGYLCCRNCFRIGESVTRCATCNVNRCKECKPIHQQIEHSLVIYGVLELGLGLDVLESLLRSYHIDVRVCSGCPLEVCSRCYGKMNYDDEGKPWCDGCVYRCRGCSIMVYSGYGWKKLEEKLCYKCVK